MALNGFGTFILDAAYYPKSAGALIKAADWNAFLTDFKSAMDYAIYKDGQQSMGADLNMNSHKLVNVTNGTNPQDAATVAQLGSAGDAFLFAGTAPNKRVGIGGAAHPKALLNVSQNTAAYGWSGSGGATFLHQLTRTVDNNPTSGPANPLNFGLRIDTNITAAVTVPVREWGFISIVEDYSGQPSGLGVAVTGQIRKHGDFAMWCGHFNALDYRNSAEVLAGTTGTFGFEANIQGDWAPLVTSYYTRVIGYFVAHNSAAVHSGTPGQHRHGAGVSIVASSADLWYGLILTSPGAAEIDEAIRVSCKGTYGLRFSGTAFTQYAIETGTGTHGQGVMRLNNTAPSGISFGSSSNFQYGILLNSGGTYSSAALQISANSPYGLAMYGTYDYAIRIPTGEKIMLGINGSSQPINLRYNLATNAIEFLVNNTVKQSFSMV